MKKLSIILILLVLLGISYADSALPPTKVHVIYNGSEVQGTFYAVVLGCYPSDEIAQFSNHTDILHPQLLINEQNASGNCSWYPETPGVTEFECSKSTCTFYPYAHPYRLAVYLPSRNRTFITDSKESTFGEFFMSISTDGKVRLLPSPLMDITQPFYDASTVIAYSLIVTLVIELITSYIYVRIRRLSTGILWSVILVNIISVPALGILLLVVSGAPFLVCLMLIAGEFAVFVFEGAVIFLLNKKRIGVADAFAMSLINNLASFIIGAVVWIIGVMTNFRLT